MAYPSVNTLSGGSKLTGTKRKDLFVGSGSGNVTLENYSSEDTIQFNYSSFKLVDEDVILVGSGASLTVKDAKGRSLGITKSAGGSVSYSYFGGSYDSSKSQKSVIQKFMGSLDSTTLAGSAALDEAVSVASGGAVTTMADLISAATLDCKSDGADKFLSEKCGIVLGNADTGAISGWDVGGTKAKTNVSIVPESGAIDTSFMGDSFTVNGLTVKLGGGKTFASLPSAQQQMWRGLYTWWTKGALDLIAESYGSNFSFTNGTVKEISVVFKSLSGKTLAQVMNTTSGGNLVSLELDINTKYYGSLDPTNVNGEASDPTAGYLDRTLAHEFTHAIMAATINNFNDLPAYIKEGMAELTHGIDDERGNDITKLASNSANLAKALSSSTKAVSVSGINAPSYAGGYILLRYLAKKYATFNASTSPQTAASGALTDAEVYPPPTLLAYDSKRTRVTVTADYDESTISADSLGSGIVWIDGTNASRALKMEAGTKAGTLLAPILGSTLIGGPSTAADKLYGNAGSDTFVYSIGGGADIIGNTAKDQANTLYQEGDKIVIVGDATSLQSDGAVSFKDSKAATTISFKGDTKSKFTVNKASAKTPLTVELRSSLDGTALKTLTHGSLPTGVSIDTSKYAAISVGAGASGTIDASKINSNIKTIDASDAAAGLYIVGNNQATAITLGDNGGTVGGGYDYAKDKGLDDKFYGGEGADVFVYSLGGGKDQIYKYDGADGDKIVLQGFDDLTTIEAGGKDIGYKDSGKAVVLTLNKDGKKGTLTINEPTDQLKVYKASDLTTPILTYGVKMPADYVGYNAKKTAVTLGAGVDTQINIDLANDGYAAAVKEVDASKFDGKVNLVGNGNSNALKASKGGSTLEGGALTKATGDKLYGNEGADVFVYKILPNIGGGTDIIGGDAKIENGDYGAGDKIVITSETTLDKSNITVTDSKGAMVVSFAGDKKSKLTINRDSADTAVNFYLGTNADTNYGALALAFTHGSMPDGVDYVVKSGSADYTQLSIGGAAANTTIDASSINSQIKTINGTSATNAVYIVGNANANNVSIGANGGTLDGGLGNDKLFGNSSATKAASFVYKLGEGKDEIYNYNGANGDIVYIDGYAGSTIVASDTKVFKDSGKDITLKLSNAETGKSGQLTLKSPTGKLTVKNMSGETLLEYGANLPDAKNIKFNTARTVMSIESGASLGTTTTMKLADYGITLKELNASAYSTTSLHLIAPDSKGTFILRAGGGGSTLQGGTTIASTDKLHGGGGADTFVYSIESGKDEVHNFNGKQGDEIVLVGFKGDTIKAAKSGDGTFTSGKDVVLTFSASNKLTLKAPTGRIKVYKGTQNADGTITKGTAVLTYDTNLPDNVEYDAGKTKITVSDKASAAVKIDASVPLAYATTLKTIDAATAVVNNEFTGNTLDNVLYGGTKANTLDGGGGNDKLYGGASSDTFVYSLGTDGLGGKDIIYGYDYTDGDVIKLGAVGESGSIKVTYNGSTVVFNVDDKVGTKTATGSLTVNGAQTGTNKFAKITTETTLKIQIGDEAAHTYVFQNSKLKNASFGADIGNAEGSGVLVDQAAGSGSSSLTAPSVDDYWFDRIETQNDELAPIIQTDQSVDLEFDQIEDQLKPKLELTYSARHQNKK